MDECAAYTHTIQHGGCWLPPTHSHLFGQHGVPKLSSFSLQIKSAVKASNPTRFAPPAVIFAMFLVYVIWGSTYLAARIAVQSFPPFIMSSTRYVLPGVGLFFYLRWRGAPIPTMRQWRNAALVGTLMLGFGTGAVAFAEQWVASGLAAMAIAAVPLWASLWAGLWGRWPTRLEGAGLLVGMVGIVLLNLEGNLQAAPLGAIVLIIGPMCWAFGSIWGRHLDLPTGMMSNAVQMICGGMSLFFAGLLTGEHAVGSFSSDSLLAVIYLATFGALLAFSAYLYLLKNVRPALATSYAYVNPVVAVGLGALVVHEPITGIGIAAMIVILAGVGLVMLGRERG